MRVQDLVVLDDPTPTTMETLVLILYSVDATEHLRTETPAYQHAKDHGRGTCDGSLFEAGAWTVAQPEGSKGVDVRDWQARKKARCLALAAE